MKNCIFRNYSVSSVEELMTFICESSVCDPSNKNSMTLDSDKLKKKDENLWKIIMNNKGKFNIRSENDGSLVVWKRITEHTFASLLSVTV